MQNDIAPIVQKLEIIRIQELHNEGYFVFSFFEGLVRYILGDCHIYCAIPGSRIPSML